MKMKNLIISDLDKLRVNLEDPVMYKLYKKFTGGEVIDARVNMYQHPDGAVISGSQGRWWVYVSVKYKLSRRSPLKYDIAIWKLLLYKDDENVKDLIDKGILKELE